MTVTRTLLLGAAALGTVVLSGCGTTTAPAPAPVQVTAAPPTSSSSQASAPSGSASAASSAPASAAVPGPVATESNPPGDIPDNQAYVAYTPSGTTISVKVPEGWARSTTGKITVFTDKLNRIEIQTATATSAPTTASVTSADVPRLQAKVPKFASPRVVAVSRTAGPVVLLTYQGDSAVDPVTGKVVRDAFERYSYFRAGTRVDLTLSGPVSADNVDPWRTVSNSLRWTP